MPTPRPRRRAAVLAAALLAAAAASTGGLAIASPAAAANLAPVVGNDISWPNCPKGMGIPTRISKGEVMPSPTTGFAVIGLTNGPGFYVNPCLKSEVDWAKKNHRRAGMYAMTTYPTGGQLAKYGAAGPWKGTDTVSRLRNAGYAQAKFNVVNARNAGLHNTFLWVDVEDYPVAPWTTSTTRNRAVVEGVVRGYKDAGISVGIYSIVRMWNSITGSWRPGLPLWDSVGPSSSRTATAHCAVASFTGGARVMTQWWTTKPAQDFDVTCPGVTGTTSTRSALYPYRSTTLRVGSTGSAVKAIQGRLGVTPTGYYGNVTRSKVIELQKAHGLRQTGVMAAAEWKAAGALTVTTGRASTLGRYFVQY